MENKSHAWAAGLFVLLVGALLIGLASWLNRDNMQRTTYEMVSVDSISGLQPQAAVRFRGVPVGKVTDITFDPVHRGMVVIRLTIDSDAPITTSTFATLNYQGVTGLSFVQLDDTGESKEPLVGINGRPPRIPLKESTVGRFVDQAEKLMGQGGEAMDRVIELLSAENQKLLMGSIGRTGQAVDSIKALSDHSRQLMEAQLGTKGEVTQTMREARTALRAIQAASDEANATVKALRDKAAVIDKMGQSADALADSANALKDNTLPRVNRFSDDVSQAARQIGRTAGQLSESPSGLVFGTGTVPPGPGEPGFSAPASPR